MSLAVVTVLPLANGRSSRSQATMRRGMHSG